MGKATNKQAQALQAKDSSLPLWEGKLKQELKWHFFFFFFCSYHVTKKRTNGIFHNGHE